MDLKFILKTASFFILFSIALAANDCDNIKNYVKEKNRNANTVVECAENESGKVIELYVYI